MDPIQNESLIAVFFSQPAVIWTFVFGAFIIFAATTVGPLLNYLQMRSRREAEKKKPTPRPAYNSKEIEQVLEALEEGDDIDMMAELGDAIQIMGTSGSQVPMVNKFEAISESDEKPAVIELDGADPGAAGAQEINKKEPEPVEPPAEEMGLLAEIFQEEIIVDPLLQAMRDSLDPIEIDDLIDHVSSTLDQLRAASGKSAPSEETG